MADSRLRQLIARKDGIVVCPGVYDGLTVRIALQDGFDCLYMTGAATSMSRLGMPDLGLVTMNDMLANAAMIASLDRKTPLIADADTGYGGPIIVARGVTPNMSAAEAQAAGFKLIIYPGLMLTAVYNGCNAASKELKATGDVKPAVGKGAMQPKDLFNVSGLAGCMELDARAGGEAFANGV